MSILTNNLKADTGEILLDGKNVQGMGKSYRKLIGYMPQEQVVYNQFSAREFLNYIALLKGFHPKAKEVQEEISELLELVHLKQHENERAGSFSGGMKRRLLFAQALLGNPQIMILDEPTAGLDPKERIAMRNAIVAQSRGRILLVATHIASDIESIATSVVLMKSGSIVRKCDLQTLYEEVRPYVSVETCSAGELGTYISQNRIYNVLQKGNELEVHFISKEEKQETNSGEYKNNPICLDDVFLYYCQ
jgi:ABC-type multidrug transport system ATPase subunit